MSDYEVTLVNDNSMLFGPFLSFLPITVAVFVAKWLLMLSFPGLV